MKILCVVLSLPEDLMGETLDSIKAQTLPVDRILLLTGRSTKPTQTERVTDTLNKGLEKIDLNRYDYIFKTDGHVIFPKDFLGKNLANEPDYIMGGGFWIVKVAPFLEVMKGKFHYLNDDAYIGAKFRQYGKKVEEAKVGLLYHRDHPFSLKYYVDRGRIMYLFGWMPLHVVGSLFWNKTDAWYNVFAVGSYFISFLSHYPKADIAPFVSSYQARREARLIIQLFAKVRALLMRSP